MGQHPKIGASKFCKKAVPTPPNFRNKPKGYLSGEELHEMLGYGGEKQYYNDYDYYNGRRHTYTLHGSPDLLKDKTLIEFKTGYGKEYLEKVQIPRGELQLNFYAEILGIKNLELHTLDLQTSIFEKRKVDYSPTLLEENMDKLYYCGWLPE
jgi:hypothetical protein